MNPLQNPLRRSASLLLGALLVLAAWLVTACGGGEKLDVGGTVSGLGTGQYVVLQNNANSAQDAITIKRNGSAVWFEVARKGSFAVTVASQSSDLVCSVVNGTGSNVKAKVSDITVTCAPVPVYVAVGGSVSGLATGATLGLVNNGDTANALSVSANGSFSFAQKVLAGSGYAVTISQQPSGQLCTLADASGTASADVSTVSVVCAATPVSNSGFTISGTVAGLSAGKRLTLLNNGDTKSPATVSANGSFSFPAAVADGGSYAVTVSAQPSGQVCGTNSAGSNVHANVTSIQVNCIGLGGIAVAPIPLSAPLSGAGTPAAVSGVGVTTIAGGGSVTGDTPVGTDALFVSLIATMTSDGANLYFPDIYSAHVVMRKVSLTPPYAVTTLAGTSKPGSNGAVIPTDAPNGADAVFGAIRGITTDGAYLYFSDKTAHAIRKMSLTPPYAVSTIVSDSTAFPEPYGVAISPDGSTLYVCDATASVIRKVVIATGAVSTFAGDGTGVEKEGVGTAAGFMQPAYIVMNPAGTTLYHVGFSGDIISAIDVASAKVSTIAGVIGKNSGSYPAAGSQQPASPLPAKLFGITTDGSNLYFMAGEDTTLRAQSLMQMSLASGVVTNLVGSKIGSAQISNTTAPSTTSTPNAGLHFNFVFGALASDGTSLYVMDGLADVFVKVH
ncbi:hypothetical protein [Rhodoferax lacus]|uniref:hypothetical protein n=1 Tax=Rhodoferax lacus TaxID=2184758 RepID=UPI0011C1044F|nr:hypothetical protein [Rhodoferax lacus]